MVSFFFTERVSIYFLIAVVPADVRRLSFALLLWTLPVYCCNARHATLRALHAFIEFSTQLDRGFINVYSCQPKT